MKTYGAYFYLTFNATDKEHAETVAAAIVTCNNATGDAHMAPETLLLAEDEIEDAQCTPAL